MKRSFNYFYKITNNINNHFYYGVHATDDLNDGYMGSGKRLHYAYKKYGMENFSKEILKFFDTILEAYKYEAEIVTEELVHNSDCYNIKLGGEGWNSNGTIPVKDKDGNNFRCSKYDPKYLSGEYIPITKGYLAVKDKDNHYFNILSNDPRVTSGELKPISEGRIKIRHKLTNKIYNVEPTDPRLKSNEYDTNIHTKKVCAKDKYGNYYYVSIDDPKYLSGELKYIWFGRKHKPETIEKVKQIYKEHKHLQGEKNSLYGTCWVYRLDENNNPINIKIKKEEIDNYIKEGWIKGRKMKLLHS